MILGFVFSGTHCHIEECRFFITSHRQHYSKFYPTAMPYFCGKFPMTVRLKWERNTVLTFKVGGSDQRQIRGQVTRPDNTVTQGFCIKEGNGNSWEKVEKKCKVVIKKSNEDDVGSWYLTIWYKGRHASKASDRRTVNE